MSNELTPPPANSPEPIEPTQPTGPTGPTSPAEIGSTMDLPFIEMVPTVAPSPPPAAAPVAATPAYEAPVYEAPVRPERPILSGPSPWTVVHGLIGLAVAVVVFITTATTATIQWRTAGPATVVGLGVVLVLLGLLSMRSRRRAGA